MENLSELTPIELQKCAEECKKWHDAIKKEIIEKTELMENLEKEINEKLQQLKNVENNYVAIIEEIDKR